MSTRPETAAATVAEISVAELTVPAILTTLTRLADPKRQRFSQTVAPTTLQVLGITMPQLRTVIRELRPQLRHTHASTVLELAQGLVASRVLEGRLLAYELLAGHRQALASLDAAALEQLGAGNDCWVLVDTFATHVAGPAWRTGQVSDELVSGWARSPDHWWRRTALVCTVALNLKARGGTGDPTRTLALCALLAADHHDMVVKALSWALRELARREPALVGAFLAEFQSVLAARVLREVQRKLETGRKAG